MQCAQRAKLSIHFHLMKRGRMHRDLSLHDLYAWSWCFGMRTSLACFPNLGLCDLHAVLCLWIPLPINFWIYEPIFMKLGLYIMTPEPISTACLYMYPSYHC
jgi:hypothetical protein